MKKKSLASKSTKSVLVEKLPKKILAGKIKKSNPVIGIVGGGQLGRMMAFNAQMRGHQVVILSDQINSPASQVVEKTIVGDYLDQKILNKFCQQIDLATIEFENIPFLTAEYISNKVDFYPSPKVLQITQHRLLEKNFINQLKIKTANYCSINNFDELVDNLKIFNKAILKTAIMGYDGKGQVVIDSKTSIENLKNIYQTYQKQPLILEQFCKFDSEISVIIARNKNGEIACYDPLTNQHRNGILYRSFYPAKISEVVKNQAKKIANKIAQALDLIGILAIEFFVVNEQLLVNELAPRPHNSGHFSIDASYTSQFEQVIRAITNSKLGDTNFYANGYMQNLLGSEIYRLEKYQKNSLAKIHLYGKDQAIDGRKMGHINILEVKL